MYDELVRLARHCSEVDACITCPVGGCQGTTGIMNRLADVVEELSKRAEEWETIADSWEKACKGLESRMPRWIPVTETNKPKAYEPVMVVYIGWNDALPHRDCSAYWSEHEGLWRWAETSDKVKVSITHYMELPPLPESS